MIAIVGAGITGLTLAHELARRGLDFLVVEAAPEPGGVIRTLQVEAQPLELGPQRTRLTAPLRTLVDELGLRDELLAAPPGLPLYGYRSGKLRRVPFTLREALRTDLVSWPGKARILLEPFTGPERAGESVASFLSRKFGREAYENMLGPLYGGLYASDPRDMLMRCTLGRALRHFGVRRSLLAALIRQRRNDGADPVPACSFRGGMRALTDALYQAHAARVRLDTAALTLGRTGGGYVVETSAGSVECDDVVFTTPADVTAGVLRGIAPEAASRLERLHYNPLAVVHLHSEARLRGMGYQVAFGERLETRGVTFNSSLFGRDGVYTAYLGGAKNPELVRLPDATIGATAAAEFELVTGHPARVLHVGRTRIPAWDRSWTALDGLRLPPRVHLAANYESRAGVPGRLLRAGQLALKLTGAQEAPGSGSAAAAPPLGWGSAPAALGSE